MKAVLLTHGHFDHIMGLDGVLKEFQVPVYVCKEERELMENAQLNSSLLMLGQAYSFSGAEYIADGDVLFPCGNPGARDLYTGAYGRRVLLLSAGRACAVQRRYAVSCFNRKDGSSDREDRTACAFRA